MLNIIDSLISTSLSSRSLVDIDIEADFEFAGITIESLLTVNSSLIVAVPEIVNGTMISFPEKIPTKHILGLSKFVPEKVLLLSLRAIQMV